MDNVEGFGWDEAGEVAHTGVALAAIVGSPWVTVGALATDSAIYAAEGDELGAILAGAGALAGVAKFAAKSEGLSATLAKGGDVIDDLLGGIKKAWKWLKKVEIVGGLPRPVVSEPKLANLVNKLYRPGAVAGTGSLRMRCFTNWRQVS